MSQKFRTTRFAVTIRLCLMQRAIDDAARPQSAQKCCRRAAAAHSNDARDTRAARRAASSLDPRPRASGLLSRACRPWPRRRAGATAGAPFSPGWECPAVAIFWDLTTSLSRGYETVWAYRLVEAAFEYAETGTSAPTPARAPSTRTLPARPPRRRRHLHRVPRVAEGADVRLMTDVVNPVRGAPPEDAEKPPNPAADAVARADAFAVLVASRDEGLASCVEFARSRRDACVGAMVAGEFLAKAAHRPCRRRHAPGRRRGGHPRVLARYATWR